VFQATRLVFYYAVTPVHMGADSAIGAIDNPIQREVHTQHPAFSGAGLKGALRHHLNHAWPGEREKGRDGLIWRIFGPETNASDYAGALSLTDAQLVALPVRSLKGAFVYITCPLALARTQRLAKLAELKPQPLWQVPDIKAGAIVVNASDESLLSRGRLVLEAFEFRPAEDDCAEIAGWLADNVFGGADDFFAQKLKTDLVILSDTDFAHFARHAMVVEPHVRIDDESGTADDGGLFFTENLPPESIMIGLMQASVERQKRGDDVLRPDGVLDKILEGVDGRPGIAGCTVQIGGDATTGRGLVLVQPVEQGAE